MATYLKDPSTAQPTSSANSDPLRTPKRTLEECHKILAGPGQMHELSEATIFGQKMKTFKNCPPSLRDLWMGVSTGFADREYSVLGDERLTYKETHRRAVILAEALSKEYGCKKGDKVTVLMRNRPDWMVSFWAIHLLGCVVVAVNAWLSPEAMAHCIKIAESKVAIVDAERAKELASQMDSLRKGGVKAVLVSQANGALSNGQKSLEEVMKKHNGAKDIPKVDITPDDDASIFFTSGTTSFPKAVLSTQRAFLSNIFASTIAGRRAVLRKGEEVVPAQPSDPQQVLLLTVPLFHVTGCTSLMMITTVLGGKVVLMHKWTQKDGIAIVRKEGVTISGGVPFISQELLEGGTDEDLKTLESLTYGGAPANDGMPQLQAKRAKNVVMTQSYGLSETNAVCIGHSGIDYLLRPLSTGLPTFVNEVRMVGPDGKDVPTGEIGELWVRGPNVFKEYYNDPKATAEAFAPGRWFKTGDLASFDNEGFVYIRDRAKDIIIRGGENISATAVENALYKNENVQDCCVTAVSDKRMGELPAAIVVLRSSAPQNTKEEDIIAHSKAFLPKHAVPVMVILRRPKDDKTELRIERNANGKIVKKDLKIVVEKEWQRRTKAKL